MNRHISKNRIAPQAAADFEKWVNFLYQKVDFNMPQSEIHSYLHTERVLLHALTIGRQIFGNDDDAVEILAHAALFHDTRRQDEYYDTGHGARAAVNYADFCRRNPSMRFHLESQYLMRYHDLDDAKGIEAIKRDFPQTAERVLMLYSIFKDADALDRWRLGSKGLDAGYLRTKEAKSMVNYARELVQATMNPELLARIDALVRSSMSRKMLLIVDPQVDFISGSLTIAEAPIAMDRLGAYILESDGEYNLKIVTADRHPWDHSSFDDMGGQWPRHCVADSIGAAIWPRVLNSLHLTAGATRIFYKGEQRDVEEYSIFKNPKAAESIKALIERHKINSVDVCGLAGDVCVLATLRDAISLFPNVRFKVLKQFSPSLDGGKSLKAFIERELKG